MNEIWKEIDGFPDYKISNWGRLMSKRRGKPKILKGWKVYCPKWGSYRISYDIFPLSGDRVTRAAHVLVMNAFGNPKPDENFYVHHKDGNPYNNRLDNLEWRNWSDWNADRTNQHYIRRFLKIAYGAEFSKKFQD